MQDPELTAEERQQEINNELEERLALLEAQRAEIQAEMATEPTQWARQDMAAELALINAKLGILTPQRRPSGKSSANAANRSNVRDPDDFYRTESWVVTELYKALPWTFPTPTLDPCAGDGAIIEAIASMERGDPLRGIELNPHICARGWNAGHTPEHEGDRHIAGIIQGNGLSVDWRKEHILQNPPYHLAEQWVAKAATAETCCTLVRTGFLHSKRRRTLWRNHPPNALVFLSSRPSFTPDGKTDSADYVWVIHSRDIPWLRYTSGSNLLWIEKPEGWKR